MPRRYTMLELVTRCKRRADQENASLVSDPEWKALISEQYGDLFSVVASTGLRYFETEAQIVVNGTESYEEPADMLALVGIELLVDGTGTGRRRALEEIMVQEHPEWVGLTGEARVYALVDDQIFLYPRPTNNGALYRIKYIPQPPDLSLYADADVVDVVTPDGEAMLVWGVALKALAKAESSVQLAMAERDAARERLLEWAILRAFNTARRRVFSSSELGYDESDWRFR